MTDLADKTAAELLEGYRVGEFTPVDATEAVLRRIGERDGALNAFVLVDQEAALDSARTSARRWRAGEPLGPGDGVPTSIKDIFPTTGWPTLRGSLLIDESGPWNFDAPCVARLKETGAVLLGKTATPEFAWKGVTDCQRSGETSNPWDPAVHAGGSSGGSASAVGAGMGPWSVGTDGGGSVRIPASFTGTVAIKPTYGTVPMFPSSPFGTLAHAGPMARTVQDTALLMDIISGFDSRDWSALPTPRTSFLEGLEDGVEGLRIAYSPTLGFGTNDPEVERLVGQAVRTLEELGAVVDEVDPGIEDPIEPFHVLWFTGAAKVLEAYGPGALDRVDPGLRAGIEQYIDSSALDYLDATAVRMAMGVTMGAFHETYDLLVTPTMPITAFDCTRQAPEGWSSQMWTAWTPYTYPFNMTQQPGASVPCGVAGGLPVGLQFVAARTQDALVLRAARAYEKAIGEQFSRPVDVPATASALDG
ncbi:amidase [Nesterenkonia lacusekhoensis]|uniref:Aspartyl-tRNA(Asn)/glutamyl-tRNA(Gln) amidotransferase subunit A n=1 Tax=Nesterenkonia lacusekhoensis TaxID=150832 RepID=A0ABS4T2Z5_9MICC|nr:amidase [Nesterenkonia lacusekhoensis]MBP2318812.1 aspartyl-tRNA(Asn)/glutamyl-tRNA(Gln) amidotransferase subunit A [Nesterenkonia lacusekhoensis]